MFYCANKKRNILEHSKAVMLLTLLMFSPFLQAESSDNADASDSAAKAEAGAESTADQTRDFKFPAWPERKQSNRDQVPPPPPGPYMSSALSDFSVKGPSFGLNPEKHELNQPLPRVDPSNVPMETFSPDRPWLDHAYRKHVHSSACPPTCTPGRWMPENGYQYVPLVKKRLLPVEQNRMPGSMRAPDTNWSGSRLPPKGKAPDGPYLHAPYYTPGNDFAPRYNAPMN